MATNEEQLTINKFIKLKNFKLDEHFRRYIAILISYFLLHAKLISAVGYEQISTTSHSSAPYIGGQLAGWQVRNRYKAI